MGGGEGEFIDQLLFRGSILSRADGSLHELFPVSIGPREGRALRDWVGHEDARRTIEVGLGFGVSALFICQSLIERGRHDSTHVAVDPYQRLRYADCGLQVLDEAGVGRIVEFHPEPSEIVLPRLLSESRSFDFAFVDGNHRFENVFLDLTYLGRLVRGGGVLFVDDYQLPAIRRAVSFFTTNMGWKTAEESSEGEFHHWVVLRTPDEPLQRAFDDFTEF